MRRAALIIFLTFVALLIVSPETASSSVRSSLEYAARSVLPSLFCFMVASKFAVRCDLIKPMRSLKLLKLSGAEITCVLAGNVCGFPSGAAAVTDVALANCFDKKRTTTLAALSNNVSPAFMISFVGAGIFGSKAVGAALYISQLVSAVAVAAVFRRKVRVNSAAVIKTPSEVCISGEFCDSVRDGALSALTLTAFIVVFSVISSYVTEFLELLGASGSVITLAKAALEITSGLKSVGSLGFPGAIVLTSFFVSLSGLCVVFQSLSYLSKANFSMLHYFFLKLFQAVLSAILSFAAIYILDRPDSVLAASIPEPSCAYAVLSVAVVILFFVLSAKRRI